MLGFESKVLMVEHVNLLLLQNGTVVFTRPVLVIIVDVELLFKSQKNKQTHKKIQADITLLQITYVCKRSALGFLLLSFYHLKRMKKIRIIIIDSFV